MIFSEAGRRIATITWIGLNLMLPATKAATLTEIMAKVGAAAVRMPQKHPHPVRVIYDTDISTDCDDTGALAMLHAMADMGQAELLAVMISSTDEYSAPCAEAINTFYGRPDIPIGARQEFYKSRSPYTKAIRDEYPNDLRSGQRAPDTTRLYRKILASQPDQSVTLVVVGFATNIRRLLQSDPDNLSSLSGPDLLARKVRLYAAGGNGSGQLPEGRPGFNYRRDLKAAKYEVEHFPGSVPMVYAGGGLGGGGSVLTGPRLKTETDEGHIIRKCYELWFEKRGENPDDWRRGNADQLRVLYAVRGLGQNFDASGPGRLFVYAEKEYFRWQPAADGHIYWLRLAWPAEQVAKEIEELMIWPPAKKDSARD